MRPTKFQLYQPTNLVAFSLIDNFVTVHSYFTDFRVCFTGLPMEDILNDEILVDSVRLGQLASGVASISM